MINGETWKACFEQAPIGLLLFSLEGEILAANAAAQLMLTLDAGPAQKKSVFTLLDPVFGETRAILPTRESPRLEPRRCRIVQDSGRVIETDVELCWLAKDCILASLLDLTPREVDGIPTDALTGLLTAAGLRQRLLALRDASRSGDAERALLMMRLDDLPAAAMAANAILVATATYLRRSLRTSDLIARWSDDCFAVVLMNADADSALHVAEGLARGLAVLEVRSADDSLPAPKVTGLVQSCSDDFEGQLETLDQLVHAQDTREAGIVLAAAE